jgi:membrane associated rhomboid family serine protease
MTKIRYSKERLRGNSRMGIFFLAIGIILVLLSFVIPEWKEISLASIGIGQIGAGILMFMIYYFENRKQYLTLKNGELIKNTLFPKKIIEVII